MATLGSILNTGKQALLIQQLSMQVIGQNTSNVNTEGYSRRRVELGTSPGIVESNNWQLGSGVDVNYLGRIRNRILDDQIRSNGSDLGYWGTQDEAMDGVEKVFSEMSGSAISDDLQEFWASWQDLSNDPQSMPARQAVLQKANSLSSSINRTYNELSQQRQNVDEQLNASIGEVNKLTAQIAKLNTQIVDTEVTGAEASDLRDNRDLAIDRLSKLMQIKTQENPDGAVNVYNGGQILVQIDHSNDLKVNTNVQSGYTKTVISFTGGGLATDLGNGEIKALIDVRDTEIGGAMKNLDDFAVTLAGRVNEVHRTGYGLTNTNGMDFFDSNVTGAASFKVSAMITDDISRIATASAANSPGDNSLVLQIAGIQHEKLLANGNSTIDDFYRDAVLQIGSKKAYAEDQLKVEQITADHLENRRQEISGVSMDEEMAHLVQVQQAYQAAAKIITTVDEMMTTIISMKV